MRRLPTGLKISMCLACVLFLSLTLLPLNLRGAATGVTQVPNRGALGGNDSVDWGQLGSGIPPVAVSNPVVVKSVSGSVSVKASIPSGAFEVRQQQSGPGGPNNTWNGNFSIGERVLFTGFQPGPLTLTFDPAVSGAGLQIQPRSVPNGSSFNSTIEAFDKNNLSLGSFTVTGISDNTADGTAPFLGVRSTVPEITRVVVNTSAGVNGDFAVNTVALITGCQVNPTSTFAQYAAPSSRMAVTSYPPASPAPVPKYFGLLPNPNPFPAQGLFALCPTRKSGCALTATATMLTSFSNLPYFTATTLDADLIQLLGYNTGTIRLCPLGLSNCQDSQLTSYNDWCELDWPSVEAVAPNIRLVDSGDQGVPGSIDQYLDDHVCKNPKDRVILKLDEFQNYSSTSSGPHYVFVTGKSSSPGFNGGTDWNVFDPGWNPALTTPVGSLSSLQGHTLSGFQTSDGVFRTFTISGVRTYEEISSAVNSGSLSFTANSPIELLVADSQGRRLGNMNGVDVVEIPRGSYIRDFPLADDSGIGTANGDPTGIKTAHVPFPLGGVYKVTATGTALGTYMLRVRTLSTDGSLQAATAIGVTDIGSAFAYQITYSAAPGSQLAIVRQATFDSTLGDINNALQLHLIGSQRIARRLSEKIKEAAEEAREGEAREVREILREFKEEVRDRTPRDIKRIAAQILLEDADALLGQLPKRKDDDNDRNH